MNELLQEYFTSLENYLVSSVQLAGKSSTDHTERGSGVEHFVARILESHLPKRAAVTTHRQIIGADSTKEKILGKGPSNQIDIIVYNEWTTIPNLLANGYVLSESVYLSLEVKARKKVNSNSGLIAAIADAVEKQLPPAKVDKNLRPETMYFGGMKRKEQLPLTAFRTGKPTYGIIGCLWGEKSKVSAEDCLEAVRGVIEEKDKPWNWPDVIYVPDNFLAFKIITSICISQDNNLHEKIQLWNDEYPFIPKNQKWPENNAIRLNIGEGKASEIVYGYLNSDGTLNLLYAFIFWLSNEILKFALERPDYHRYLMTEYDSALCGRHGAGITENGVWTLAEYGIDNKNNDYAWILKEK